ncbi:MAG: hypothetical protein NC428_07615 [Clostridium sp.]|nr:hypothetical protein [Clostridium sp.]
MMYFMDKKTGEAKTAYLLKEDDKYIYVNFKEGQHEYKYSRERIEIIDLETARIPLYRPPFPVYKYFRECYNCGKGTMMLTYMTYKDNPNESLVYPYDMNWLLHHQSVLHVINPKIEYYSVMVLGDNEAYDKIMLEMFPYKIKRKFSQTIQTEYAMNICEHCGAKQGKNFIYIAVNRFIKDQINIPTV